LRYKVGGGYLLIKTLANELDRLEITKETLSVSGIEVIGIDQAELLLRVAEVINGVKGNIRTNSIQLGNEQCRLRFIVAGLDPEEEQMVRKMLEDSGYFTSVRII
jgi:UTP:GlnB (protein PII) uridylyltransferase